MNLRSLLYKLASLLGDVQAAKKGPWSLFKRYARKQATKRASRSINRFLK